MQILAPYGRTHTRVWHHLIIDSGRHILCVCVTISPQVFAAWMFIRKTQFSLICWLGWRGAADRYMVLGSRQSRSMDGQLDGEWIICLQIKGESDLAGTSGCPGKCVRSRSTTSMGSSPWSVGGTRNIYKAIAKRTVFHPFSCGSYEIARVVRPQTISSKINH